MAVVFKQLADAIVATPEAIVDAYNSMVDTTMVQPTTTEEMTKLLKWTFAPMHRLYKLNWLDEDGNTVDVIDNDVQAEFNQVLQHSIVLLVNNWRQTQFFQVDDNGKSITENTISMSSVDASVNQNKYNPVDNTIENVSSMTTRAASTMDDNSLSNTNELNKMYNLFEINLKADQNLSEVCKLLLDIYNDFRQHVAGCVIR